MTSSSGAGGEPPYLVLVNSDAGTTYDLLRKKTVSVARAGFNGDLEIHGDMTVSRSHAEISCIKKTIGGEVKFFMRVLDKSSKFGTYVNEGITSNRRIENNRPVVLSHGDSIRFGLTDSGLFRLMVRAFNVCMSTLKKPEKIILDKTLKKSKGISVQRDLGEDTTHLCMNSITVTEKALISLAVLRPIVTVQYFIDLYEATLPNSSTELPFSADYLPPLVENILNRNFISLDINPKRKALFSGKTFFCSSEAQINRIAKIIKAANGSVLHHADCQNMSINDILNNDTFILMQQDPCNTETGDQYQMMLEQLLSMNKRPIPENEIGLAIIFASTEKHCNPQYNMSLIQSQSSVTRSQAPLVLAQDTEEVKIVENSQMFSVNCIPDSLPQTSGCYKRPLEVIMDSDIIMMPNKRPVLLDEVNIKNCMDMDVENIEPSKSIVGQKKTILIDSCVTQVPCSQDISKENDMPNSLKGSVADKNKFVMKIQNNTNYLRSDTLENNMNYLHTDSVEKNTNYLHSDSVENNIHDLHLDSVEKNTNDLHSDSVENNMHDLRSDSVENILISNKRKISNLCSVSNNEDNDPFDYMDIDEVELPPKKPKNEHTESMVQPVFATKQYIDSMAEPIPSTSSGIRNEFTFKKPKSIQAVEPFNIMNLLADVKGTDEFIDASKSPDISSMNLDKDPEYDYLMNSVIIETKKMVNSRSSQTRNSFQGSNSNLKNFKKFKKKGPVMRIPHIVPLDTSLTD